MKKAVKFISKRIEKRQGYAVKPANPLPSTTGSVVGNSLNAANAEGGAP
jgi:hypothetical protein